MRPLALLLSLLVLSACDTTVDPVAVQGANLAPGPDSSGAYLLESKLFSTVRGSFDWNFHIDGLNASQTVPVSFRTYASDRGTSSTPEMSRVTMTNRPTGGYGFTATWAGYDSPWSELYPVVVNANGDLVVQGPYLLNAGETDNDTTWTDKDGRSYHNTGRGIVIDYTDTDGGQFATLANVSVPSQGLSVENVAYLVYVPKGSRPSSSSADYLVAVYGPEAAQVVTESVGYDELPREVTALLPTE